MEPITINAVAVLNKDGTGQFFRNTSCGYVLCDFAPAKDQSMEEFMRRVTATETKKLKETI